MREIDLEEYIILPIDKALDTAKAVYDMSQPAGLGFLHAQQGGMPEETVKHYAEQIEKNNKPDGYRLFDMDYVHGRQCKFTARPHPTDNTLMLVDPSWYDHSDSQLVELLTGLGVEDAEQKMSAAAAVRQARYDKENEAWEAEKASREKI